MSCAYMHLEHAGQADQTVVQRLQQYIAPVFYNRDTALCE